MKTTINRTPQPISTNATAQSGTIAGQKSRPNIVVARALRQARRANH